MYDEAFRRAGVLRVYSLDELFDAAETLSKIKVPRGEALAILTNGGGAGVLATDTLIEQGGRLAELGPETMAGLDKVLPPTWSHGNPIDIIGDAPSERYERSLGVLLEDTSIDAVLVLNCPTAVSSSTQAADAAIRAVGKRRKPIVLTNWLGGQAAEVARRRFDEHGIPSYETPSDAVRAFMHLVDFKRNQIALAATPPSIPEMFEPDVERARELVTEAASEGREWLTEPEAKEVLTAYGIETTKTQIAHTASEAGAIAEKFDEPVALKILSPDITHKSDVGGVVLDLQSPDAVEAAAHLIAERVGKAAPKARITGFVVQNMVHRPRAYELIVGVAEDAQFGPTILFGQGGTAVEVIKDKALALPPLDMNLCRDLIGRTRIYQQLKGYRDRPPVDLDAIALTLIKVSQIVVDLSELAELDINPLLADDSGAIALDARIRVKPFAGPPQARLAIKPYPKELEEQVTLGDGRTLLLRPIRAEDEPALQAGFAKLTPEEVRFRFFIPMKILDHFMGARLAHINYDRQMALVLTDPGPPGKAEIYAVVRVSADPDNERGEFALIVRGDMTGMGLGVFLMRRIIEYCRSRGMREIYGDVLTENKTMLKLCEFLGFKRSRTAVDPAAVRVALTL